MSLPGQSYSGWTDELLAERNAEQNVRLNHMEAAVLLALSRGHDTAAKIVAETGLTLGQVQHALGVLGTVGMSEASDAAS
jgi:hypothetical protein